MEASETLVSASNSTLQYLPSEMITDILSRLPVETLLRFKRVCKTWNSVISSTHFSKTHLNFSRNSKNYANHSLIFSLHKKIYSMVTCSLRSILDINAAVNPKPLYHPVSGFGYSRDTDSIYGNCNGLLCLRVDSKLALYNPTTQRLKTLPDSGNYRKIVAYGLCYHELDDDYRVVELCSFWDYSTEDFVYGAKIYSLRSNSWREITDYFHCSAFVASLLIDDEVHNQTTTDSAYICYEPGLPVGGLFHWKISNSLCQIFVVDTVTYTHGTLAGPRYNNRDGDVEWGIMDFGGYLGVYHEYSKTRLDIWMMKGSWTKVVTLPYNVDIGRIYPLVGLRDGEILLRNESGYSISISRKNSFIEQVCHDLYTPVPRSLVYIESLVDPSFNGE